jgi:transcriptional regulator with XRE-family HTH domain
MDPLRAQLRRLREAAGLTQRQLAAKIGVAHTAIQSYEDGRNDIPLSKLRRFADGLGLTVDIHFRPHDPNGPVEEVTPEQAFLLDLVHRRIRQLGTDDVGLLVTLLERMTK